MKKTLTLAVAALVSASAFAQTVTSANIVGYVKTDKTGARNYSLVGVNFTTDNQTLSEVLQFTPTGGYTIDTCDQVSTWNSATQNFDTYLYYYYNGTYPDNEGWKLQSDFSFSGALQDPVLASGSGVWVLSAPAASTTNIIVAGDVESAESVTNQIVEGLNILANPYPVEVVASDLEFTPTGGYTIDTCDQISVWNPATQTFDTYLYYYYNGSYPDNEGWKLQSDFSFSGTVQSPTIGVGEAFWYRAKSNLTWIATKPY